MFQHVKYTHTHNRLSALFPVLLGELVPEETFTHWYPSGRRRKRRIHTDNKLLCLGAHSLYGALSQRGMLVLIKPACNQGRPDGRLKLTASFFDWLNQYAGYSGHNTYCYGKLAASCISFHHYCSPSSGFCGAGKDNRQRHTDNPSRCHPIWTIGVPTSIISPFLRNPVATLTIYPDLGQVPNNAGLHTQWLGSACKNLLQISTSWQLSYHRVSQHTTNVGFMASSD